MRNAEMTSKIKSVSSPSHPITFHAGESENTAGITLANQENIGVPLVKNFEMQIALSNPDRYILFFFFFFFFSFLFFFFFLRSILMLG
jgi:hypothetical protein